MRSGNDANVDNLGELDRAFGLWRGVLRDADLLDAGVDCFAICFIGDHGPSFVTRSCSRHHARACRDFGSDIGATPVATGADR